MEQGYAICFNEWALDKSINGELGLLLIISSLCAEKGFCYASNEYLSKLFKTTETTITRKIRKLKDKNYITVEYKKRGSEIIERKLRLTKMSVDRLQICKPTAYKNVKENNISIKNININNKKKEIYKEKRYFENENLNELFNEFLQMRKKLKAINSDRAIQMLLNKLNNYDDDTKIKMIEKSIVNSWKGIFELKDTKTGMDKFNETLERWVNK